MKRKAQNPAQAGDAVLAFYYDEYRKEFGGKVYSRMTKVLVNEKPNLHYSNHHQVNFILEFWGPSKGIVNIVLPQEGNLFDAILTMNFSKKDVDEFSHIIIKRCGRTLGGHGTSSTSFFGIPIIRKEWNKEGGEEIESIYIYRLDNLTKSHILAKTEY